MLTKTMQRGKIRIEENVVVLFRVPYPFPVS
jgi:hypothetical protein